MREKVIFFVCNDANCKVRPNPHGHFQVGGRDTGIPCGSQETANHLLNHYEEKGKITPEEKIRLGHEVAVALPKSPAPMSREAGLIGITRGEELHEGGRALLSFLRDNGMGVTIIE